MPPSKLYFMQTFRVDQERWKERQQKKEGEICRTTPEAISFQNIQEGIL